MSYGRIERRIAALLDSTPRLRGLAKSAWQRANYVLLGRRGEPVRLHPRAAIRLVAGGRGGECFFGYFGMQPWSADSTRYLFHRVNPAAARTIEICVHDYRSGSDAVVAESRAWNFQQGAMAQWLRAGEQESVVFNDVLDRTLVCRIVAADGRETRHPWPIQALHPRGTEALALNYRRLERLRSDYGYRESADNFATDLPLERDGIWLVDLASGTARLVVSLRRLADTEPSAASAGAEHEVNHAVYSPGGSQFVFMHRWVGPRGKYSRLYRLGADGTGLELLLDHRMVSHYAWRDDDTLLVWARTPERGDRYYLLDLRTKSRQPLAEGMLDRYGDGHPSWSPDGRWIVTDTYPDRQRMRRLLLYRPDADEAIEVGVLHSPWRYDGSSRCDLHPRWSPDGRRLSIDSSHEGFRGTYEVDVGALVG